MTILWYIGIVVSFLFDMFVYYSVKTGIHKSLGIPSPIWYKVKSFKYFMLQSFLWALVWPLVVGVTIYCKIMKVDNNKRMY